MISWTSPFTEARYVPLSDPQRQDGRSPLRAIPRQDDRSPGRHDASVPRDHTQVSSLFSQHGEEGPLTFERLMAFGVMAWGLGIILAVIDRGGQFSTAPAIGILLLLGCLAFLVAVGLVARRVRAAPTHIVTETDIRDPLTGLPDERYLLLRLEEEMTRSHRQERSLTLAILDVNNLAAVNEQYGRDCGDEVIRHVAAVAQETKRASDALARMSDDEFAIILAECSGEGALAFAGRLTERLARQPLSTRVNNRPSHVWVGVCVGLAVVESDEDTAASLLDRARADLSDAREERDHRRQRWRTA